MFNISLDIDYLNIYRRNQNLPLLKEKDIIITKALGRACNLLHEFNFKSTFFVIGDSVKEYKPYYLKLIEEGNEIGNHTLNHLNLLELPADKQEEQIGKCQELIKQELGVQPAGFKAPGYGVDENVYSILAQHGIKYDTSCFNNILVPLAKLLYYLRSGKSGFGRLRQMFKPAKIHKRGELAVVPVGSAIFKLPFYGSFHAMYPELSNINPPKFAFTYLIHPLEFLENHETGQVKTDFRTTLKERVKIYRKIFGKLKDSSRRCVLLKDMINGI